MKKVQILILNKKKIYEPLVVEGVQWTTERKGVAGKLVFEVLKDKKLDFTEGNAVKFLLGKKKVFSCQYLYIFEFIDWYFVIYIYSNKYKTFEIY